MERLQGDLYVRKATLEYEGSARYDDQLEVGIRCARIGNTSMTLAAAVFRGPNRLVQGELVYVFADPRTQTPRPVPAPLRELLETFERGQPVFEIQCGGWQELGPQARQVRREVFVVEQGLGEALVGDGDDEQALHAVLYNRLGMPLAGGRLQSLDPAIAKIGRLATVPALRGAGLGRAVLASLVGAAREGGHRELRLDALESAAPFYEKAGFARSGGAFVAAGLPHVEMRQPL
jgi:predicted GNAT family N-acyltransferase